MDRARALWSPPVPLILTALSAWIGLVSLKTDGNPVPAIAAASAAAGAYLLARLFPVKLAIPAVIVVAAAAVALSDIEGTLDITEASGLFGYSNARGQFFALAAFAALMLWARLARIVGRSLALIVALAFVAVPIVAQAQTAAALALGFGLIATLTRTQRQRRVAIWFMLAAFLVTIAGTTALGLAYPRGAESLPHGLGHHRIGLWHDAALLAGNEPIFGAGPGRFPFASAEAGKDGSRRASHGFLQLAAETGILGGALLAAAFACALVYAAASRSDLERITVIGAAVVTSFGIHGSVDYVLHFPWLVVMAAGLAGSSLPGEVARVPGGYGMETNVEE